MYEADANAACDHDCFVVPTPCRYPFLNAHDPDAAAQFELAVEN
jgi:hypothetical protein